MNKLQTIVNKISADSTFRTDLLNNPGATLENAGFTPNSAIVSVLGKLGEIKEEITDPNNMWAAC